MSLLVFIRNTFFLFLVFSVFYIKKAESQNNLKEFEINNNFQDTIPLKIENNLLILEVFIQGTKKRFVINTASPSMIFPRLQKELQLTAQIQDPLLSVNDQAPLADVFVLSGFKLGNFFCKDLPVFFSSGDYSYNLKCMNLDGVLGADVFSGLYLETDFKRKRIVVTNVLPDSSKIDSMGYFRIPMTMENEFGIPVININPDSSSRNFPVKINTGYSGDLEINSEFFDEFLRYFTNSEDSVYEGYGIASMHPENMEELSQRFQYFKVKLGEFRIGTESIKNINVRSSRENSSSIGMGIMSRGTVILDFIAGNFYFKPYDSLGLYTQEKEDIHTGLEFAELNYSFYAGLVWKNSPAYRLGIEPGNRIVKYDGMDLRELTPEGACAFIKDRKLKSRVIGFGNIKSSRKRNKRRIKVTVLNNIGKQKTLRLIINN